MPKRVTRERYQLPVHKACERIRYALGWTRARMATELGLEQTTYCRYEGGWYEFSRKTIERIREVTGIDPYVLAFALFVDYSKWPPRVNKAVEELRLAWEEAIEQMRHNRQRLPSGWW